jgi:hypothetical protein
MSAAPARLAPQAILALLHESTPTALRSSEDPAPVDVNAALARLDAQNLRRSIAARNAP